MSTETTTVKTFDSWAVVELMGHVKWAGKVSEEVVFGTPMVRIDVPETSRQPAFTKFYGANSIYCLTPTTEEVAKRVAETIYGTPIVGYIPPSRQLTSVGRDQDDEDDYNPDNY
jgi:hypothetical protein